MADGAERLTLGGGCHCGAVRFAVEVSRPVVASACNCSLCQMSGFLHVIVPQSRFNLIQGQDQLSEYRFNTGVARHLFCKQCGVKSFYQPRSNPDGWSVNARCLDQDERFELEIEPFDGRNWEANASALAHLSQDLP